MNHSHRGRNLPASFLLFLSLFSGGVEIKRLEYLAQKKLFPFRRSLYSFDRWLADLAGNFVVQGRVNLAVRKWTGREGAGADKPRSAEIYRWTTEGFVNSRSLETIIRKRRWFGILSHPFLSSQTVALSPRIINSHARSLRKKGKLFLEALVNG